MYFVVVAPLLVFIFTALGSRSFGIGFLFAVVSFFICMEISSTDTPQNENTVVRDTTEISEVQIGGEPIYVATGTEDGQRKYTYWTKNGQKTVGSRVKIFDSEETKVVTTSYEKKDTFFFFYNEVTPDVKIYVPKNKIKYNYNLQAK